MVAEHRLSYMRALSLRHLLNVEELIKISQTWISICLFTLLVYRFAHLFGLHVQEWPACQTWLESEAIQRVLGIDEADFTLELLQSGGYDRLVFYWVQRAR